MNMETAQEHTKKLIFIYNADSGVFNLLGDVAKKAFKMDGTCSLCDLTHNPLSMKDEWKTFIENLPYPTTFLHKNEFIEKCKESSVTTFPAMLLEENGILTELLDADTINSTQDLNELKRIITDVIS